jgi:N6-L-threonylcarbamoyladenine synthase
VRQQLRPQYRTLLTLAIETSCDDTSVAILEKTQNNATLHFHEKVTSDNRIYQGIHPLIALESHQKSLAKLVQTALQSLPIQRSATVHVGTGLLVHDGAVGNLRKKPDFITVTRGPGMRSSLNTGLETAKGLAVAWQVPMLGVNHMQAHALTPRLVSALEGKDGDAVSPEFPFLTLLVSGGHTMLVHSRALCDHQILAKTSDLAIGDVLDKAARDILPPDILDGGKNVMYGRLLESFAFPNGAEDFHYAPPATKKEQMQMRETEFGWAIKPPLSVSMSGVSKADLMEYSFSGVGSSARNILRTRSDMDVAERRCLGRETMRIAFEHLVSRLLLTLQDPGMQKVSTVVVSGGVASNQYLKHILRAILDKRGFEDIKVVFPPPSLCTDNAAMIAWTGMEMWEAGWETDLGVLTRHKWSIDADAEDGGILGADGWTRRYAPSK